MVLNGKNILLCVTGSIAAYKSVDLYRRLKKEGALVKIIVSSAASRFIPPYLFESFGEEVFCDDAFDKPLAHISLSGTADLILIAPATFNTINKIAAGLADSLITLAVSASPDVPKLLVPAMNYRMYGNKILTENIKKLEKLNFHAVSPEKGELACGDTGDGRFPDMEDIIFEAESVFTEKSLKGKNVIVTAGATREYMDSVRFISNGSSGLMGISLANEARKAGASVTLVASNIGQARHYIGRDIRTISCGTFDELRNTLKKEFTKTDVLFMAAAVSDFGFKNKNKVKIKKASIKGAVEIIRNEDLLQMLSKIKRDGQTVVGFAAEDVSPVENGKKKLKEKSLDFIFVNDISKNVIGCNENEGVLIKNAGGRVKTTSFGRMPKKELARRLIANIF